jgi:hypothetical protein
MELSAANRRYDAKHEEKPYHDGTFSKWTVEPTKKTPYHYRDGVSVFVSATDLNPEDDFL